KNSSAITKWKTASMSTFCVQWERYMRCDGYPDPKDQRAVNTFISLWRDDLESNVLLQEAKDPKEVLKYQEALMEMQELFHSKHLFIAEKILKVQTAASFMLNSEDPRMKKPVQPLMFSCSQGTCEKMDPDVVDVMQYTSVGGVFYCDLFHLPPRPIRRKGYTILQDGLRVFPYPTGKPSNEACPPVGVSVTLPDWITNVEPPLVARWDAGDKQWRWDGITDVSYEKAEAKISFKMETFQTFALMQKTYANLPFQGWELRPLGQDSVLFTIKGAIFDITITIKNDQCMLQLEQQRGLSHLMGKWMSGHALQKAMLKAGVNIFVNEHTHKYVSFCRKESLTEQVVYKQMALFASACAFSWSKWNAKCGEEHLVLQVFWILLQTSFYCEQNTNYFFESQKLKITENSEAFSPDHVPGSLVHNTFIHMLEDNMSPDGIDMTRHSNYCFVDTVQNLLCATRPLVFS
uniref:Dynein axonemal intermediate chain 7 n=1 Tax=Cyprinodon variegatus TaxID=28743 RepID=A0A3Q2CFS3_CYPVA